MSSRGKLSPRAVKSLAVKMPPGVQHRSSPYEQTTTINTPFPPPSRYLGCESVDFQLELVEAAAMRWAFFASSSHARRRDGAHDKWVADGSAVSRPE